MTNHSPCNFLPYHLSPNYSISKKREENQSCKTKAYHVINMPPTPSHELTRYSCVLTTTMRKLSSCPPLLLLLHLLLLSTEAESNTFPGDIAALKSVVAALDPASIPPGSCLASWDFNLDPCLSAFGPYFTCGLRCDATSSDATGLNFSRVTDISLDSVGYSGPLSLSIWSLPFLQSLDISNNRLYGPIPSSPPPLLRRISLSRNSLSGPIPSFPNSPSLEELYLDGNRLSGPFISPSFPSLRRLDLQSNNLSGSLPDLRLLSNLNFLDASDNSFFGPFPSASLPSSLFELSMRNNHLTGNLPGQALASLPTLQVLDLSHNALSGPVPAAAFNHTTLEQLSLAGNAFEWVEEPAEGGTGSIMVALDLERRWLASPTIACFVARSICSSALAWSRSRRLFVGTLTP
ncbi:leucine-rich repeat receptor-like protein kinase PXL1 [Dendrobium catenatum]|uniref:Putative LRR receptor-like serine/threonine-protein kinase n=1 Tax=Dendrobium catenatum TaxID=906689 RepID=A0A2I0VF31_9ASPA|nr:leucine-rich repeat receptor-like protein kinase PXL1 [Dendrobium catenatum]PKU62015.1 putative LRR receptor-like serine/threonine-protein kinase [Dendrobium catenatum]